jgi:anti-anti-sigma regulatory factor
MTPVTRSDSSGAHFIHDLAKDLKAQGIQLVLCNPTDTVRFRVHNCRLSGQPLSACLQAARTVQQHTGADSEGVRQAGREAGTGTPQHV